MLIRSILRIAWRNLRKNWHHSTAALCSIVAGFCVIGIFEGYMRNLIDGQVETFGERRMYGQLLVEKRNASIPEGREDLYTCALGGREQRFLDDFLRANRSEARDRVRFLNTAGMVSRGGTNAVFIGVGYDVR